MAFVKHLHPKPPLKADPNKLEIVKGNTGKITVSGGSGVYTATTTTANIKATVEGNEVTVTTNLNSASSDVVTINDGASDITVNITTIDVLKASPDTINIVKGQSGEVTISGGKEPYSASTTTEHITASVSDKTVTINADETADATDTLTITDSSKQTTTVAITTSDA